MLEAVAARFGLARGEPISPALADHRPALEPVWQRLATGLVEPDFARAVGRRVGDFVFGSNFDVLSDTTKIRMAGVAETVEPFQALIAAIERQCAAKILPNLR